MMDEGMDVEEKFGDNELKFQNIRIVIKVSNLITKIV
jgi:hypothetical protein